MRKNPFAPNRTTAPDLKMNGSIDQVGSYPKAAAIEEESKAVTTTMMIDTTASA